MSKLYTFGCSFSDVNYKNNTIKHNNYPEHMLYTELLSNELKLELVNNGYSGRGSNSILLDFAAEQFEDNSVVIVQLTLPERVELRKINRNLPMKLDVSGPITHSSILHYKNDPDITEKHVESYVEFVYTFNDILTFTDVYFAAETIFKKEKQYPTCRFYLITPHLVKKELFVENSEHFKKINLNGFIYSEKHDNWIDYAKRTKNMEINDDPHLSPLGNYTLFDEIIKFVK